MHPIVYYILIFLAIGGAGMALANRKASNSVRQQRWLKYFTYIIFTGIVVLSIFYNFFFWLACAVTTAAIIELLKVNSIKPAKSFLFILLSMLVFFTIAAGFILFAHSFQNSFVLFIYFQVLVFDGFCQITGQLVGKHPLAPLISPAKTWEGLAGGWFFCIIAAMLANSWLLLPFPKAMLFGLLTGLTSFTGDLLASWYKRKVNVKDYSNWLPGQGGFLDRFDSFIFTSSIYYLLFSTIFKQGFEPFFKR